MLRQIHKVLCWPALESLFKLQLRLAEWLCNPGTTGAQVNEQGVRDLHQDEAVQDWLWQLLNLKSNRTTLLEYSQRLASQSPTDKQRFRDWIIVVKEVAVQFQSAPSPWLRPPKELANWTGFKQVMEAFYRRFASVGIPFDADGRSVELGITYSAFVKEFKDLHGDEACVMCGGHLSKPQVDHWVAKASFPILSITPDNVVPICYECNVSPCKGDKDVFDPSEQCAFGKWFHPFHRPGFGRFTPTFDNKTLKVRPEPIDPNEAPHVVNLDNLFQLSDRWTRVYKARDIEWRKSLRQLIMSNYLPPTEHAIFKEAQRRMDGLVTDSPNSSIDRIVYLCSQDPARLNALVAELSS